MISSFLKESLLEQASPRPTGRVARITGLQLEVEGVTAAIGDLVLVDRDGELMEAEVVAVRESMLVCSPYGHLRGLRYGSPAIPAGRQPTIRVGWDLLSRVVDARGLPLDGRPPIEGGESVNLHGEPPRAMLRASISDQLALGIRAIDTLVPCGIGQRLGIFAGSGVGKSSTLSMIARGSSAEVNVVALIGERGREVNEFIFNDLGPEGLARSVVVVATSDEPPLVRIRAAYTATRIAEWFRDQGKSVVLMMDSLTRLAMAQREVGLSAGEPPATRGYPPSAFALLPKLLERAGNSDKGNITGLYTVLVDGDEMNEPISDAARSILDGHIVLSRRLATSGQYPAVDVLESISRLEGAILTPARKDICTRARRLLATYREAKDIIEVGAYQAGSNPEIDRAIFAKAKLDGFLRQPIDQASSVDEAFEELARITQACESVGII